MGCESGSGRYKVGINNLSGMQTSANIASTGSQSNALMVDDNEIRDSI
jgi:hypothetical protein